MDTTLVVVLVGLAGAGVLAVVSALRPASEPLDPEATEHWLIDAVEHRPRLARALSHTDRRVAGGVSLVIALVLVLAGGLLVGALLETVGSDGRFARWDDAVAGWGADHEDSVSVDVLRIVTDLGGTLVVTTVVVALAAVAWLAWRRPVSALFLGVVLVGILLVNNVLKWIIERDRPDVGQLVGSAGSSFPSGHTATAAAVWAAVALVLGLRVGHRGRVALAAAAIGIACAVAASRALLGVHWLTDVLAGLVVGWVWFLLVALAFGGRMQRLGDMVDQIQDHEREVGATTSHEEHAA